MRAAAGCTWVDSAVAATGPMTNVSSSSVDSNAYAVWSCSGLVMTRFHRARTNAPGEPPVRPLISAGGKSVHAGRPKSANTTTKVKAAAEITAAGYITRRCPYRSTRFDSTAVPMAHDTTLVAASAPANPVSYTHLRAHETDSYL